MCAAAVARRDTAKLVAIRVRRGEACPVRSAALLLALLVQWVPGRQPSWMHGVVYEIELRRLRRLRRLHRLSRLRRLRHCRRLYRRRLLHHGDLLLLV